MLKDKVVLVTGGASGIGRASALNFSEKGANVIVSDVNEDEGEETVVKIKEKGSDATFVKADVGIKSDVENLICQIIGRYGRLDCAFNNAGIIGSTATTTECTEEDWDRIIQVNLKGVWLCMKYEILEMLKQGYGTIVNTSSIAGLVGGKGHAAYYASKHGIIGLTRAAAIEYGSSNIRVNAVCPGSSRTALNEHLMKEDPNYEAIRIPLYPIGRLGLSEEVAEAAAWLLSDNASFVTGHSMAVDGGYTAR